MKIWVDNIRPAPDGYIWCKNVNEGKVAITHYEHVYSDDILILDLEDYSCDGGDCIKLLDWLERQNIVDTGYFFKIHSMNPAGIENMKRIIERNGWKEVLYETILDLL